MKEEWRVVHRTRGSTLKQLWARLRSGLWVPTERFMCDAQMMPPILGGSPGTVDKQVAASGDDGGRWGATGFQNNGVTAFIGDAYGTDYHIFARWTGVTIEGTIDVSYIECYAHANGEGAGILMKVYGVDEDNPPAPTTWGEFDADPLTTAAIDWDGPWTTNTWEQSPSLNTIFQELVDTYAISNEAVMVQVKDDGSPGGLLRNQARMYDYSGNAHGPKLHIEYSVGNGGKPTIMDYYRRRREL